MKEQKEYIKNRIKVDSKGCWIWQLKPSQFGYAVLKSPLFNEGKGTRGHRETYKLYVGEIPEGKIIDHICRVRNCVNPKHLRPLTRTENTLIGEGPTAVHARKTHCVNGHSFSSANTDMFTSNGGRNRHRRCKKCLWEATKIRSVKRLRDRIQKGLPIYLFKNSAYRKYTDNLIKEFNLSIFNRN